MANELSNKQAAGCAVTVWVLLVTTPMWLVLLFVLLNANDVPAWAWVLYWCYLPAHVIGGLLSGFVRAITEE